MQKNLGSGIVNYPMPIALIGTNRNGKNNFMTAAWISMVSYNPPRIAVTLGKHLTSDVIHETKVFSVCFPPACRMTDTDYCGLVSGRAADKSEVFTVFYGETGAPMAEECGLNAECRLNHIDANGVNETFVGDIVGIYADESVLTEGKVDFTKLRPFVLSQLNTRYYTLGLTAGEAWSEGRKRI